MDLQVVDLWDKLNISQAAIVRLACISDEIKNGGLRLNCSSLF